jgi:predicted anti-sigma-YlaC factor YlaD
MDCRSFRKQHFAYLDDTLSGDDTSLAQGHLRDCDPCRAHDTLVRRSLMMARSLPPIEPSTEFQERLRASLDACREERAKKLERAAARPARKAPNTTHPMAVLAAGMVLGAAAWSGLSSFGKPETVAMQPVAATQPAVSSEHPYITPALMQAMSTGNPVWPAAVLIEDVPTYFVTADLNLAGDAR